jgi:uncharacterized RDD family membrane protein YckC
VPAPSLWRRFAAILYDSLLLAAVLMAAALPATLLAGETRLQGLPRVLFQLYLLVVMIAFFVGFWRRGGQTAGMRAWRLRVVNESGGPITLREAVARFFFAMLSWACLGLGYWWVLIDPDRRAWHDRLSKTHLILLPKQK